MADKAMKAENSMDTALKCHTQCSLLKNNTSRPEASYNLAQKLYRDKSGTRKFAKTVSTDQA